jgi:acetyl esterase/lipase
LLERVERLSGRRRSRWAALILRRSVTATILFALAATCSFAADNPPGASTPNTVTLPPRAPLTLAEARKAFKTTLTEQVATKDPVPAPPANVFRIVKYDVPIGKLSAYLTPDPGDRKKRPAIVWITGGDCNSVGDVWSPAPPANDQTAAAYRQAGIVMMFPSLRGGNGNPGHKEGFYGEVDDVLAAATFLAAQPHVDPKRIYLGGHSTGGSLALLVAAAAPADRFRAVFSFGPVDDVARYGRGTLALPFDAADARERAIRAPARWLHGVATPTFVFEGDAEPSNQGALAALARSAASPAVRCFTVNGKNHFSLLAPLNTLIAAKITRDAAAGATTISFAANEVPGLTPVGEAKAAAAAAVPMTVIAKTATEPAHRVNIDTLEWEVSKAAVERYHGRYVEVRGAADGPAFTEVRVTAGATSAGGGDRFGLVCGLVRDRSQREAPQWLTPGQEVLVRGVLEFGADGWRMRDGAVTAVGPDPAVRVTATEARKAFAADAKGALVRFTDRQVVLDGIVRELDAAKYQVLIDSAAPAPGAPAIRVLLGESGFRAAQKHAVGTAIRVKARFSSFQDGQIVLEQGRVMPAATAGATAEVPTIGPVEPTRTPAGAADPAMARPAMLGNAQGRFGSYSFPKSKRLVGLRYDLDGAGLKSVSAFSSGGKPPPLRGTEKLVQARDGYMVYGLVVDADKQRVNAVRIVFVRVDGDKLVPTDTYTSDWLGTPRTDKPVTLGADGRRVTGIKFFAGDDRLNAVGLDFEK